MLNYISLGVINFDIFIVYIQIFHFESLSIILLLSIIFIIYLSIYNINL